MRHNAGGPGVPPPEPPNEHLPLDYDTTPGRGRLARVEAWFRRALAVYRPPTPGAPPDPARASLRWLLLAEAALDPLKAAGRGGGP